MIKYSEVIVDMHLIPRHKGYIIAMLGKNGEPWPSQPVEVELNHRNQTFDFPSEMSAQFSREPKRANLETNVHHKGVPVFGGRLPFSAKTRGFDGENAR